MRLQPNWKLLLAPESWVQSSSALFQCPPKPNVDLSPPARTLPGTGVPCGPGKRHLESSPNWSCRPFLHPLALRGPRPDHSTVLHTLLTVAVREVEVSLGTGIAVLPSVIGLAVTAASEVLTGAIGEVRLTVTACRGTSQQQLSLTETLMSTTEASL